MNIRITNTVEPTFTVDEITQHINSNIKNIGDDSQYFINTINDGAKALWHSGQKIKAIKLIRTIYPLGLREAKEYCDSNFDNQPHSCQY